MNFENYFVSLLQETGCEKVLLVQDDAVSPRNNRNKKQMAKESIADFIDHQARKQHQVISCSEKKAVINH
jgi:hypothetical protein